MMARYTMAIALMVAAGCAALGPRTEGAAGAVSWKAEDLELVQRSINQSSRWSYSFSLVVRETRGVAITFNEIQTIVYQPGTNPSSPIYRGVWPLSAYGAFRIPLSSGLTCRSFSGCQGATVPIPSWRIILGGTDERGASVREVLDLRLPADPPPLTVKRADSIPAINLTTPRPAVAPPK